MPTLDATKSILMQRRTALKQLAMVSTTIFFLPACQEETIPLVETIHPRFLSEERYLFLKEFSNTLLPVKDLAISHLGSTADYILTIVEDCFDTEQRSQFEEGLAEIEHHTSQAANHNNGMLSEKAFQDLCCSFEETASTKLLFCFQQIKSLSIEYLMTSEFFQKKYLDYEFVPARFLPCQSL